jgi:hypothetical protein
VIRLSFLPNFWLLIGHSTGFCFSCTVFMCVI